jgi:DNA-binding beta-propeller fold protein YncE
MSSCMIQLRLACMWPRIAGVVSVIDDQRLETLESIKTESGAHTIGWNPDTRTLYAFLPASGGRRYSPEK